MFCTFFQNIRCIFREAKVVKLDDIQKVSVASYVYNVLNHGGQARLRSSVYTSFPGRNYHHINRSDLLLPYPRVEVIRMSFRFKFLEVWL